LKDVAVKVLTVQDFHDDQLKEFLREVCIDCIHEINVLSCLFIAFVRDLDCINYVAPVRDWWVRLKIYYQKQHI
jgi:hypothetical protein